MKTKVLDLNFIIPTIQELQNKYGSDKSDQYVQYKDFIKDIIAENKSEFELYALERAEHQYLRA